MGASLMGTAVRLLRHQSPAHNLKSWCSAAFLPHPTFATNINNQTITHNFNNLQPTPKCLSLEATSSSKLKLAADHSISGLLIFSVLGSLANSPLGSYLRSSSRESLSACPTP